MSGTLYEVLLCAICVSFCIGLGPIAYLFNYLSCYVIFYVLEFIVNHNFVYDSCGISEWHQINEDSNSDSN